MANIRQLASAHWQVQIRLKGRFPARGAGRCGAARDRRRDRRSSSHGIAARFWGILRDIEHLAKIAHAELPHDCVKLPLYEIEKPLQTI
ncbi:MAG TPA: hypothetical protein VG867_08405 [Rhizomicrobium sp.]|nr:hypothetical protein [Rhizomicrobium sp.]